MTFIEIVSKLNYILGRLEGIGAGCGNDTKLGSSILDTAEMLSFIIEDIDTEVKPEL